MPTQGMDPNATPPERREKAMRRLFLENLKISSAFENRQSNPGKTDCYESLQISKRKGKIEPFKRQME